MANTRSSDQLALDEKVVNDGELERLLDARGKAKDEASLAAARARTAHEAVQAKIDALDIGPGAAVRIGKWRIEYRSTPARSVSFETDAKEGFRISPVGDDE